MVDILYFSFVIDGWVVILEAIASMTIKQSYVGACVCVDLLRHFLWYSVFSSPTSPTPP